MASPTPVIVSATPAEGTSPTTVMLGSSLSSSSQNVNRSGGSAKRKRTKPNPPIFSTVSNTYVDKSNDFPCPICFELIDEAYMTKCGHSFCHQCITNSLEESNRCPKCNFVIERKDQVFPNFLLNELILKYKQGAILPKKRRSEGGSQCISEIQDIISSENLELSDVNFMLGLLKRRKEHLQADSKAAQLEILKDFLIEVKRHKKEELDQLVEQINCLDEDLKRVDSKISSHNTEHQSLLLNHVVPTTPTGPPPINLSGTGSCFTVDDSPDHGDACHEGFNASRCGIQQTWSTASLPARRKRVHQHFNDLETCYFNMRQSRLTGDSKSDEGLEVFTESLAKFTRFSGFRPLATLSYASDIYNGSSIVSSIEFDRDCDYFAIAGVTKKIKVFEYNQVVRDVVDIHYPVHEMTCNSKISCITWSQYHKSMLASSDYEGTVTLWDAFTGTHTRLFQEHEKRCWSLDFNMVDPKLLASGSDDAKVKLWATNMEHSVASLEAKANVCCVKFNPESRYHLAFGSADHCVHYYDLRNPKKALGAFKGHRKAVSYAKFVSPTEIVSAPINSNTTLNLSQMRKQGYQPSTTTTKRSTDSQLKLWDVPKQQCLRTYKGHTNEKNFVGLATNGDYIACGSENNSLFVYYKGVSKQLLTYKFDTIRSVLEKEKKEEDANEFVSAVCWKPIKDQYLMWLSVGSEFEVLTSLAGAGTSATKPDSNIVVAANSQGSIKSMFPSENHDGELCYPEMNKNDDLNPNMAQRQVRTCQFNPEEKY